MVLFLVFLVLSNLDIFSRVFVFMLKEVMFFGFFVMCVIGFCSVGLFFFIYLFFRKYDLVNFKYVVI